MATSPKNLPTDATELAEVLQGLSPEQLAEAEATAVASLDKEYEAGDHAVDLERAGNLAAQINAIRAESATRETAAAEHAKKAADLRSTITPKATTEDEPAEGDTPAEEPPTTGDDDGGSADEETAVPADVEAVAASMGKAIVASIAEAFAALPRREDAPKAEIVLKGGPSLNRHLSLGNAARYAPNPNVPDNRANSVLVASADIPGLAQGSPMADYMVVANAMHQRARMLGVSQTGDPQPALVASLNRDFRYTLSDTSTFEEVDAVLKAATDVDAMVAAGGWCAPSEISYDFFNLICEEGLVDLPSVGVLNRGGFRFPTSPTMADVTAGSPDGLWTWTETDDQSAVTGAPVKDCVRVPCPSFSDVRLACDGFCVTGGNLMDFAYPENIANWIRLVMATRAHVTNARVIGIMNAASVQHDLTGLNPNRGVFGAIIEAMAFEAADQRARFATCSDQIVEFLAPEWLLSAIKADYAYRTGIDNPILVDSMLIDAFDSLNVRVQFVQDYQVRGASGFPGSTTAPTVWPASVQMLAYLPGTFVRGQGLQLNLGVVRDSVLNATNDFTAAWAEDCYAVAQVGWLSRRVVLDLCVSGSTGAANITC